MPVFGARWDGKASAVEIQVSGWIGKKSIGKGEKHTKELGDDPALNDNLIPVFQCRNQPTWVHFLEIPFLPRLIKVNDDFLELETKFGKRNVCAVCPRAAVAGVTVAAKKY